MRERNITLGRGIDVAILEAGAGGRPLLLVHGFTGAKEDFADHAEELAGLGWHVVAPDLRGHGGSSQPVDESDYSLELFAADVLALLDALGWNRLVLLGHSMGGMIAQIVALARPSALEGLVLMDTAHGPLHTIDRDVVALAGAVVRDGGMPAVKAAMDALGSDTPLGTAANDRVLRERPGYREFGDRKFLSTSPAMYATMLEQLIDQDDRLEQLATLTVPVLVIVGEEDKPFLKAATRMHEAIPGARHALIPEAGHSPQFENPGHWFGALSRFLSEV